MGTLGILIAGGGASGALLACALVRALPERQRVREVRRRRTAAGATSAKRHPRKLGVPSIAQLCGDVGIRLERLL